MSMQTLTCKGCGATVDVPRSTFNIMALEKETSFKFILTHSQKSVWLCNKECVPKIVEGYKLLEAVLGEVTEDTSLYSLSFIVNELAPKCTVCKERKMLFNKGMCRSCHTAQVLSTATPICTIKIEKE